MTDHRAGAGVPAPPGGLPGAGMWSRWPPGPAVGLALGLAPWVVVGALGGPGRTSWAVGTALALAVLLTLADAALRRPPNPLNLLGVPLFAALLALALTAGPGVLRWLDTWLGAACNAGVAALIAATLLTRRPFTLRYAREQEPPRLLRRAPDLRRIHYGLSAAWAGAFLIAAAAGVYGELALHNPSNAWASWIIQLTAVAVAAVFSSWYPRVAGAGAAAPPVSEFLDPLLKVAAVIGVVSLALGIAPVWFGVALIVVGLVGVLAIHQSVLSEPPEPLR